MSVNECISQLLSVESSRSSLVLSGSTLAFGCARLGHSTQLIISGTLDELHHLDFGPPLHSLCLCGPNMHEMEQKMWEHWHWNKTERTQERQHRQKERDEKEKQEREELRKERRRLE